MAEAHLDALAGDLDTAAAGHFPLDSEPRRRERIRAGQADALEPVTLAGRDGAGQGPPQDPVLGDDVHDLTVNADAGSLAGQRGADLDDLLPRVTIPAELTSRCTSTQLVAARAPGAFPAGGGPAGRAQWWRSRARSTADSREGTVLIRHPPMLRCTVMVSIQNLTVWPVLLVPRSAQEIGIVQVRPIAGPVLKTATA